MKQVVKNIGIVLSVFVVVIVTSMVLSKNKVVESVEKHLSSNNVQYNFLSYYNEMIKNDMNCSMYNLDIHSFDELEANSDYIVRVKTLEQSYTISNFVNKLEVLESYKGNINQKEIYVFHPGIISESPNYVRITLPQTWLLPMKMNEEYILYLNKEETYGNDDLFQYTTIPYSIIPIRFTIQIGVLDNQTKATVTLNQDHIKDIDICFPLKNVFL